jgi:hypothetical protein
MASGQNFPQPVGGVVVELIGCPLGIGLRMEKQIWEPNRRVESGPSLRSRRVSSSWPSQQTSRWISSLVDVVDEQRLQTVAFSRTTEIPAVLPIPIG